MAYSFDLEDPSAASPDDSDEDEETLHYKAMIPLADLLNADATRNNARLFQFPAHLEMRTIRDVAQGEELLNDYGPLPRTDLLRRYGYTSALYAPYDVVEVSMDRVVAVATKGRDEAEVKEKVDWLLEEGVLDDSVDFERGGEVPEELCQVVKVLLQGKAERRRVPSGRVTDEVREVVKEVVRERLQEYGTTVREDRELLKGDLGGRERDAVEVRLGEKEILWEVLERLGGGKREAEEGAEGDGSRMRME